MRARPFAALAALALITALQAAEPIRAADLQIHPARADRSYFVPSRGEKLTVRFRLSAPAEAQLLLYDARDVLVRRVTSKGTLAAGEHALSWDGRSDNGKRLPSEAYSWVVRASAGGKSVEFDLTDQTGTDAVIARDVVWDPKKRVIRYLLPEASRVNVRVGLQGDGPLLRTLVNWLPRQAGVQEEPWEGWDESHMIDLSAHPKLKILIHAVGLPTNTIVIGPRMTERTEYVATKDPEKRTPKGSASARRRSFAAQPVEQLRDVEISLALPKTLPRDKQGLPIVGAPVPIEMDVPDRAERARLLAERVETAFFVDGAYRFENEAGSLPATWTFDPTGMNPGEHYITGNLLGYEGHFGTATLRIRIPERD
jgi:hypothetical protein